MNISKRAGILVIVLIIITIALVYLIPLLSDTYIYTNPSGEEFKFTKTRVGNLQMHVLTAYASYKGDKTN